MFFDRFTQLNSDKTKSPVKRETVNECELIADHFCWTCHSVQPYFSRGSSVLCNVINTKRTKQVNQMELFDETRLTQRRHFMDNDTSRSVQDLLHSKFE